MKESQFIIVKPSTKTWPRPGFTLIEILIVIAIIGVLATFVAIQVAGSQSKARDGIRKANLRQINDALREYYVDKGFIYPSGPHNSTENDNWIPELNPYFKTIPKDPKQTGLITSLAGFFNKIGGAGLNPQVAGTGSDTFYSDTSDGYISCASSTNPPDSGSCVASHVGLIHVGQLWDSSNSTYSSYRGYLAFNTSFIGNDKSITSVKLRLAVQLDNTDTDFNLKVRNYDWGSTLEKTDWGNPPTAFTEVGSAFNTSSLPTSLPNYIELTINPAAINKTSPTRFMLTSEYDERDIAPYGKEKFSFSGGEDATYKPQLVIEWSQPDPTPTPYPGPSSTPTSSPPAESQQYAYGYFPTADQQSFTLWAHLERSDDPQTRDKPGAPCQQPLPSPDADYGKYNFNYCLKGF